MHLLLIDLFRLLDLLRFLERVILFDLVLDRVLVLDRFNLNGFLVTGLEDRLLFLKADEVGDIDMLRFFLFERGDGLFDRGKELRIILRLLDRKCVRLRLLLFDLRKY